MVLRTIPADVQAILERNGRRPQGWYKTHIIISLGTSDRAAAKAKCSAVASDVERHLKALRDGPRPLTALSRCPPCPASPTERSPSNWKPTHLKSDVEMNLSGPNHDTLNKWAADAL